jgi:hypothetical protein
VRGGRITLTQAQQAIAAQNRAIALRAGWGYVPGPEPSNIPDDNG